MDPVVIVVLIALVAAALLALLKPELRDRLADLRDYLVAQPWFPNRRVLTGALVFIGTWIVAHVVGDVDEGLSAGISLAAAKVLEYLLPPADADINRSLDYKRRKRPHSPPPTRH